MRYFYEKPEIYLSIYGETYICEHPVYSKCTLFKCADNGLAVIQQRYNSENKSTWWSELDPWLTDVIYTHKNFKEYFESRSGPCRDGLYPTVTVRQLMWGLRMKPLKKERWETCFDRKCI